MVNASPQYPNVSTDRGDATDDGMNRSMKGGLALRGPFASVPNTESLAANKTIAASDPWVHYFTPTAARNVTMPATTTVGTWLIFNMASTAGRILTIKDAAAATIGTIDVGQAALVMCDGTTWSIARFVKGSVPFTDNSTGTAGTTIAAGVGTYTVAFYIEAASIANGDLLTEYVPGHKFKVLKFDARCAKAVTTGAKAATLNLEIETTNVTGGAIALSGTYAIGAAQAGSAITAANTGSATEKLSIEAASVTAFVEGAFWLIVSIQNMDTADAIASLAARS